MGALMLLLGVVIGVGLDRLLVREWDQAGITGLVRRHDRLSALRHLLGKPGAR